MTDPFDDQERFAMTAPQVKPFTNTERAIWFVLGIMVGLLLAVAMTPLPN
jgi:hypothetical protein